MTTLRRRTTVVATGAALALAAAACSSSGGSDGSGTGGSASSSSRCAISCPVRRTVCEIRLAVVSAPPAVTTKQNPRMSQSPSRSPSISAVTSRGTLRFMLYEGALNAGLFLAFLQRLVRGIQGKVFLIVDNLQVHKAGKVQAWVAERRDKIELFFLPAYAPEHNPDEYLIVAEIVPPVMNLLSLLGGERVPISLERFLLLVSQPGERRRIGMAAHDRVENLYSIRKNAPVYLRIIDSVANDAPLRGA